MFLSINRITFLEHNADKRVRSFEKKEGGPRERLGVPKNSTPRRSIHPAIRTGKNSQRPSENHGHQAGT